MTAQNLLSLKYFRILLVVLTLVLMLGGCSSLPKDVQRTPSFAREDTTDTRLARDIRPLVESHQGLSGFYLLQEGTDAFAARLSLIKAAEKSLDVQYYIWHDDLTGKVLYNRLLDAADRGVRVRLLLDDLDTAGKDEMLHMIDAHPNIEIRLFNPFANRDMRAGDFLTDTRRVNRRMHNKTLTADNQATIFGGRNIGDEYFDATEEVGFRDLDALAIGPVVNEISQSFDLYWNSLWVYPLAAFKSGNPITDVQIEAFKRQSDAHLEEAKTSDYADALRALTIARFTSTRDLGFVWGRWVLVYDHPSKVDAKTVKVDTHLAPSLIKAFDKTNEELLIVSPYFVPGSNFTEYLTGRVEKGVRVRIMTNSLAANDVALVHAGYMRYRKDLINGGVELFEYKPNKDVEPAKQQGKEKWTGSSRASLHAKYFGFDRRYVFLGSFNLDARSVALNTELGVYFESPEYAKLLSEGFEKKALVKGYQLILNENGDMRWLTMEGGKEVQFTKEPETGFWKRFTTGFMSIFVPESQL